VHVRLRISSRAKRHFVFSLGGVVTRFVVLFTARGPAGRFAK